MRCEAGNVWISGFHVPWNKGFLELANYKSKTNASSSYQEVLHMVSLYSQRPPSSSTSATFSMHHRLMAASASRMTHSESTGRYLQRMRS